MYEREFDERGDREDEGEDAKENEMVLKNEELRGRFF